MRSPPCRSAPPAVALLAIALAGCSASLAPGGWTAERPAATLPPAEATSFADRMAAARARLVVEDVMVNGVRDEQVLDAMRQVPRHLFVPPDYVDQAYEDHPLPIGHGQTISQPTVVGLMTEALALQPGDRVLEIGAGSGYQAAVLAQLVDHVYTVEIVSALVDRARANLAAAGYDNVTVQHGDGYFGWPEHGPYDAIIVTAAPDHVPPPLKEQLADGGRLVIPVGPVGGYQELWLVTRTGDEFTTTSLGPVAFVPLTRRER